MEANASLEEEEVVNYAHAYDRKVNLLFRMHITQNSVAFCCWCSGVVSTLHLQKLHPRTKSQAFMQTLSYDHWNYTELTDWKNALFRSSLILILKQLTYMIGHIMANYVNNQKFLCNIIKYIIFTGVFSQMKPSHIRSHGKIYFGNKKEILLPKSPGITTLE